MKKIKVQTVGAPLIKHIGLIAKAIGLFPIIIIVAYGYSRNYNLNLFWVQLIGIIGAGYLGCFQMKFKVILESALNKKPIISKLIITLSYLTSIAILILLSRYMITSDGFMKLIFFIMSLALFIIFMKDYKLHYSHVLSLEIIVTITGIYTIAMILCKYQVLGLLYLFIVGSYLFIGNQLKIEELLERTQKNTPLFANIKKENAKWVCLVMSLIFIGYPFRNIILQAMKWAVMKVLGIILFIIIFIIDLLPITESSETPMETMPGMGELPGAEKNEFINLLLWGIVISLAVFVIYKYRESILAAIRERIIRIKVILTRVYRFLFDKTPKPAIMNSAYEDHSEEISEIEAMSLYQNENINRRKWKKAVKKYLKQDMKSNSVRDGYKLILQGAKFQGVDIRGFYTPREIKELVEEKIGRISLTNGTAAYEEVRYGEYREKFEQVNQIKEVLNQLLDMNK